MYCIFILIIVAIFIAIYRIIRRNIENDIIVQKQKNCQKYQIVKDIEKIKDKLKNGRF
ncbi:hypothetical protein FACS1894152_4130 [Bacilli bacterium]|nr:hypothetical protein FACS1894152_4130 [Bacilli bacterium]